MIWYLIQVFRKRMVPSASLITAVRLFTDKVKPFIYLNPGICQDMVHMRDF